MSSSPPRDALQRFLDLLLAGCMLALVGTAFFSHVQNAELEDAVEAAQRSRDTLRAVDGVERELASADAALLDHLLTGQPGALATCLAGVAAAERRLADLEQYVDAGADQRASLRRLQALGAQKLAEFARVVALRDAHPPAAALGIIRSSEARQRTADIRAVVETMTAREQSLLTQRNADARASRDLTQYLSWLTEFGMALAFAGGWFVVRRELRARVAARLALIASQRELEASERRVRALADALPALIGYIDRDETYRFANCAYERFFDQRAGSLVGKTLRDLLGARGYAVVKGRLAGALAGTPQRFERCDELGGRKAHLLIHYVPDRDARGEVVGVYVRGLDITDRKNAELAQQVNERRLRAITDNVPAIIAHLDREHRYLHTNEGFRRLWGTDPGQLLGRTLREFRGEFVHAQIAEHLLGVLHGETRRFEVREVIDGIEHHFQQSLVPDIGADGNVQGYYSVSFDITDLRRNEQLLMESSARLRSIVGEQSDLVSLARPDGELIHVNPACARHVGMPPAALVGMNLFDLVLPADRDALRTAVAAVIGTGESSSSEHRLVRSDGRECRVAWTHALQRDFHGDKTLRSVGRDVTEQRRAEQALRASEAVLDRVGRLAGARGFEVDLRSGEIVWSRPVCRIEGLPEDPAPTLDAAIGLCAPASRPSIEAAVRRGIRTRGPWDLELQLVTASGREVWVRAVGDVASENGRAVRLVGAVQDITGRKRAEAAVEQKDRLLRAVTDPLSVLAMYVDDRETVRFLNATGAAWLGIDREAALDRPLALALAPRRYADVRAPLQRALAGAQDDSVLESELDGRPRHLHLACAPDARADGSVAGAFVMVTDVTGAREARRRLERPARSTS